MGNCAGFKDRKTNSSTIKHRSVANSKLSRSQQKTSLNYKQAEELETPGGPNVADMAMRADTEFEMMHKLDTFFCCGNLEALGRGEEMPHCKIEVFRINDYGQHELMGESEIVDTKGKAQINFETGISIEYMLQDTVSYEASLIGAG